MKCTEMIKKVKNRGWFLSRVKGSHYHFKHPVITGLVTVPFHKSKELNIGTLHSIARSAGIHL